MYAVLSTLFVIGVFLVVAGFLGRVGTDGISDVMDSFSCIGCIWTSSCYDYRDSVYFEKCEIIKEVNDDKKIGKLCGIVDRPRN